MAFNPFTSRSGGAVSSVAGLTGAISASGLRTATELATDSDVTHKSLTLTGGTITADAPILNASRTWNNAGVTFTGIKYNATDTASAAASLLLDLQVGAASKVNVRKDGVVSAVGYKSTDDGDVLIYRGTTNSARLGTSRSTFLASLALGTTTGSPDVFLSRSAAAVAQFGDAAAASPVAQTVQAQGSRSGTDTNVGGGNFTVQSGQGTGTGTASSLIFRSPVLAASGTGAQTMTRGAAVNDGSLVAGPGSAVATDAVRGFLYIPACAGTPTGTPTAQSGAVALVWDTTNKKLYVYDGAWLGGTAPGVFS